MRLTTKAGIVLAVLGLGVFAAWHWWTRTRNLVPVRVPIPLAAGQSIAPNFKLNFNGLYLIEIEADKTIPVDTLHCLLGVNPNSVECKEVSPVIAANWVLSAGGQELKRGSSEQAHSAPADSDLANRVIGEFHGESGTTYNLQVIFTHDASALADAHPRLKVAVASIAYTDLQSAGVLVFSVVFICEFFGAILLGIAYYAKRRGTVE